MMASLLALMPHGLLNAQVQPQDSVVPNQKSPQAEQLTPDEERAEELRGVMILRVSERYLAELFARDIDKHSPVVRVVLGTHARGTAHTVGRAEVNTKPDNNDAAFSVKIHGTTSAMTVGRNGPAIIHSCSMTNWTARKIVRFDGDEFTASPASITCDTRIHPLGADSVLPGLRGRIVSRIASQRAVEYNSTAERIVNKDTERRVLADVDRVIDGQIAKLNDRVESRPMMALLLPKIVGTTVKLSTSSKCINISFGAGEDSEMAKVCPVDGVEPSDTELWFQTALVGEADNSVPDFFEDAGAWLTKQLPSIGLPGIDLIGKAGILPMDIKMVDGWVVLRTQRSNAMAAQTQKVEEIPTPSLLSR
jgi:hypothetical protein